MTPDLGLSDLRHSRNIRHRLSCCAHPDFVAIDTPVTAGAKLVCCDNRPLNVEERALLWRFRYSLISEARALTKFLKCVDWGDAQEARQAAHLMQAWAPIAIADALDLLSPDFPNEQVSCPASTLPHPPPPTYPRSTAGVLRGVGGGLLTLAAFCTLP